MSFILVGIDWADRKHDVCIMAEDGSILDTFSIPHTQPGLQQLRERVQKAATGGHGVLCALETDRGLLVSFLLDQGWTVYAVNPKSVDRYRERTRVSRVKSDALDAWLLADFLRTDRHIHRHLRPDSEQARELRELTRDRETLVRDCTRLVNRLKACLKAYFPEVLPLFPDLACPWALSFLAKYPTRELARKASSKSLQSLLKRFKHPRWEQKAGEIHATLRQPHLAPPPQTARVKARQLTVVVGQLQSVVQGLKEYDREIERLLQEHPDSEIFRSLPGAGTTLAARMLAEIGDNRDRYANANSLQCEAGTAPVTKQSGKTLRIVQFRQSCKKPLRHTLQLFAWCSLRHCPWALAYYQGQRAKGKRHTEAVRSLANKWLKIIYAMWVSKTPYDASRYLADREKWLRAA